VVAALHQERTVVLRAQHASISTEVGERQRISANVARSLQEEILEVGSTILNLTRPDQPDLYLNERVTLDKQRRGLTRELRAEQIGAWRDVQELRREQRGIEHELLQGLQRRRRMEDLSAPGPL
jgi:hypothetical protein